MDKAMTLARFIIHVCLRLVLKVLCSVLQVLCSTRDLRLKLAVPVLLAVGSDGVIKKVEFFRWRGAWETMRERPAVSGDGTL